MSLYGKDVVEGASQYYSAWNGSSPLLLVAFTTG
jgi:hypothetical protein